MSEANSTKKCRKCGSEKPLAEFYQQRLGKFGRTSRCVPCVLEENRLYKLRTRPAGPREARVRKQQLLAQGLKECTGCNEVKPVDDFFMIHGRPQAKCKSCEQARHAEWKSNNREHMTSYVREYTAREDVSKRRSRDRLRRNAESPRYIMAITLCHGLKRHFTESPATADDLMEKWRNQKGRCAISDIVMTWNQGKVLPTSISLDRIDPLEGYSKDNVRLVCHAVNAFRGRMTDAEMLLMAKAIVANMEKA